MPDLSPGTFLEVAEARAALAALDSTSRQLPNPSLLQRPVLRREAQSTSALEGTYAPLREVLVADESHPSTANMREILNYEFAAQQAFAWQAEGRPLTVGLLEQLHGVLVRATPAATAEAGRVRGIQVVIGLAAGRSVHESRFVPSPPGPDLKARLREVLDWIGVDRRNSVDPVVAAAMAHYQFETLHPFDDGNGRIGRLLIVLQLSAAGVLAEPTLTVSPWFESRRDVYYDVLLSVSTHGEWDGWTSFFAQGLAESAVQTRQRMVSLIAVQAELRAQVRTSRLRAESAQLVVDHAVANPSFTVRDVEAHLGMTYARSNKLVADLVKLGVLASEDEQAPYRRRFSAPAVIDVLLQP